MCVHVPISQYNVCVCAYNQYIVCVCAYKYYYQYIPQLKVMMILSPNFLGSFCDF